MKLTIRLYVIGFKDGHPILRPIEDEQIADVPDASINRCYTVDVDIDRLRFQESWDEKK